MMDINKVILHHVILLSTSVLSQYVVDTGFRPDVTFGDHNDRFDVSSLMNDHSKYFRADGNTDYRRKNRKADPINDQTGSNNYDGLKYLLYSKKGRKKLAKKIRQQATGHVNSLANKILLRLNTARRIPEDDFVYHDKMESDGKDVLDFEENLARFRAPPSRRSVRKEQKNEEINVGFRRVGTDQLSNYAFPISMQISGYLMKPENNE